MSHEFLVSHAHAGDDTAEKSTQSVNRNEYCLS